MRLLLSFSGFNEALANIFFTPFSKFISLKQGLLLGYAQ